MACSIELRTGAMTIAQVATSITPTSASMDFLKCISLNLSAWAPDIRYSSQAQKATSMKAGRISADSVNAVALRGTACDILWRGFAAVRPIMQAVIRAAIDALRGLWQRVRWADKELAHSGEPHGI
jgi:hypothetical protein